MKMKIKSFKKFNEQVQHPGRERVEELCKEYGVTMTHREISTWAHADNESTVRSACLIKSFDENTLTTLTNYIDSGQRDQNTIDFFVKKGFTIKDRWEDHWFPFGNPEWYEERIQDLEKY